MSLSASIREIYVLASLLDRYLLSRLDLVQIWEWGGKISQIEESIVTTGCKLIKSAPTATSSFKVDSSLIRAPYLNPIAEHCVLLTSIIKPPFGSVSQSLNRNKTYQAVCQRRILGSL